MKKRYMLCAMTSLVMILLSFVIHGVRQTEEKDLKIGFIFVGDEMSPYTGSFIKARDSVEERYGDQITCITKYNVGEEQVEEPLRELVNEKCDYIIAASYGYGPKVKEVAKEHPEIQFCVPTGDNANEAPVLSNYHTCMETIYQGRYICGVVAGVKLKEMIDDGIIKPEQAKVGYVATFPNADVISGYTAFYLGVQSVVPEATMLVKYTDTSSSYSLEKRVTAELIEKNCVVISQHSDTTGPATACESASGRFPAYHVGYIQSMTDIAPTKSLISCTVDYSYYFQQSVYALLHDKRIEECIDGRVYGQDAMAGIDKGWVRILDINTAIVPDNTNTIVNYTIDELVSGRRQVFAGDFTGTNPLDETDRIDLSTPFTENAKSSRPTFHYVLDDVITVLP